MRRYTPAAKRKKIGHITPSSNTVVEPLTNCVTADLDHLVSNHFTRIRVESISLDDRHTSQFTPDHMLAAAEQLADARVDAIVWNGTSGGWNGLEADREICALIEVRTGIVASTSTLAQFNAMATLGATRYGLATPYTTDVTARVADVYAAAGIEAVGRSSLGIHVNREFANVTEVQARELIRAADHPSAEAILFVCTGVAAAQLVDEMERELGKPVIDSLSVVAWEALRMVGIDPVVEGWGRLFTARSAAAAPGAI
ncbi:MAG: aspartate/glutamate racemase family protein [Solirubrobacteraceae bacterium]|nr:aspartate/glutamate racemase family protein [Solirubrobacteraceae bacterium]